MVEIGDRPAGYDRDPSGLSTAPRPRRRAVVNSNDNNTGCFVGCGPGCGSILVFLLAVVGLIYLLRHVAITWVP